MNVPSAPARPAWTLDPAADAVFRDKFEKCVHIFRDWVAPVRELSGATILDFGCGDGVMALGMSLQLDPARVIGVELTPDFHALSAAAKRALGVESLPGNLDLQLIEPNEKLAGRLRADVVFSWSVFEHVSQELLDEVVTDLRDTLSPGGHAFIQIAPLYYSADGAHLFGLTDVPWAHLRFQANQLRALVANAKVQPESQIEPDAFQKHKESAWSCYLTLNKLTADELVELFLRNGFELLRDYRTDCAPSPPAELLRVFHERVLRTEQIAALFRKR